MKELNKKHQPKKEARKKKFFFPASIDVKITSDNFES